MKITNSTTSFTGYSNVLAKVKTGKSDLKTYFITAQLNDIGEKDLTKFKSLMWDINKASGNNNVLNEYSDIITITYKYSGSKDIEILLLDNFELSKARELKSLEQNSIKENKYDLYKLVEQLHMKVYTFLAQLTKRMSMDNSVQKFDGNNIHHISGVHGILEDRFLSEQRANEEICGLLFAQSDSFKQVSRRINKVIDDTMRDFFDVK